MDTREEMAALSAALEAKRQEKPAEGQFGAWFDEVLELEDRLAALKERQRPGPLGRPSEAAWRPSPVPRRERAPARRPARLVDHNGLTRRDRAVYAYIRRKAKGAEAVEISNQELAYGTGYKRRSIQLATAALHCAGKVLKKERRVAPTQSLPNRFFLPENRRFSRPSQRQAQGCKKYAQNSYPDSTSQDTSSATSQPEEGCNRLQGVNGEGARRPLPRRRGVPPATAELSPADVGALIAALRRLEAPGAEDLRPGNVGRAIPEAVEALKASEIPEYPGGLWNAYVRQHGSKAYFAVVETVAGLRGAIPRPEGDGPIRRPGAYLTGILRKAPEDVRPEDTVRAWLAIAERERPLPRRESASASRYGPQPTYAPVERRPVLDLEPIRLQLLDELRRTLGGGAVAQWLEPLELAAVGVEEIRVSAPSRFIRDYVKAQHSWDLARAAARVLRRTVAVRIDVGTRRRAT